MQQQTNSFLWEILVPTKMGDNGNPVRIAHHRQWDSQVLKIAGGLTVMTPSINGYWISNQSGITHKERTIPVRIMCTTKQIYMIAKMTKQHYRQEAVMFYRLSSEVVIY